MNPVQKSARAGVESATLRRCGTAEIQFKLLYGNN
jgi:hypothetical protein